jgi:hypothetical protein
MSRRFNKEFWTMVEGGQSVFQAQAGVRLKVRPGDRFQINHVRRPLGVRFDCIVVV